MDGAPQFNSGVETAGRDQVFGYECRRCLRCCRHKRIQLNPYEVARLARARGLSTTELRARHTVEGRGVELAQAANGDCVFLGPGGCTVHPDRPLVCRLYPLGRFVGFDGQETFRRARPHPESAGVYHDRSTIADFLADQQVEAFTAAADAYMAWLAAAMARIEAATGLTPDQQLEHEGEDSDLTDMDAAIAAHCQRFGLDKPADLEDRLRLHLEILYASLPLDLTSNPLAEEGTSHAL
ncbi:MAG: YkgJ family cysteine cluster protein [Pseudomonadota bacterium]|jgi:Fe-S-cluster containining protein